MIEALLLIVVISILLCNISIMYSSYSNNNTNKKMLTILQDLQDITNLDIPKETNASLVDVGKRIDNLEILDNISRTSSLWEEDSLEGEEIEEVYGK